MLLNVGLPKSSLLGQLRLPTARARGRAGDIVLASWGWLGVWIGRVDVWSMNTEEAPSTKHELVCTSILWCTQTCDSYRGTLMCLNRTEIECPDRFWLCALVPSVMVHTHSGHFSPWHLSALRSRYERSQPAFVIASACSHTRTLARARTHHRPSAACPLPLRVHAIALPVADSLPPAGWRCRQTGHCGESNPRMMDELRC